MANNKVTYGAGVNQVGLTASRFTADTTNGDVTLFLPSIEEVQRFQTNGSGINIAGTFNYAFEKIGSGQLIFRKSKEEEFINGSSDFVINEIGSGIIFLTSDNSWGISTFAQSNNQITTNSVDITPTNFDNSNLDNPIIVVPAQENTLIVPTHIIINVLENISGVGETSLNFGYKGLTPFAQPIILTGLLKNAEIIAPISSRVTYQPDLLPDGKSFVVYKKLGNGATLKVRTLTLGIKK